MSENTTLENNILEELGKNSLLLNPYYFSIHKERYKNDLKNFRLHYEGGEILEIGSYPFHFNFCLKSLGLPVIGLDVNPQRGKDFLQQYDLTVEKCDIENEIIPFNNNRFSFIFLNEVFEHLRINPIHALQEIYRVLKPCGSMILTTPNLYALHTIILFISGNAFRNTYKEFSKLLTTGHMGHIREYSTKEVRQFLENTGFIVKEVRYEYYRGYFRTNNKFFDLFIHVAYTITPSFWQPFQIIISSKKN